MSNPSSLNVTGVTAAQSIKVTKRKALGEAAKIDRLTGAVASSANVNTAGYSGNLNNAAHSNVATQKTNLNKQARNNSTSNHVSNRAHQYQLNKQETVNQKLQPQIGKQTNQSNEQKESN